MNSESTLQQTISAMISDQNVQWCAIWDSQRKDYTGIVTIRDILEIFVYLVDRVKECLGNEELMKKDERSFVYFIMERYLNVQNAAQIANQSQRG